MKPVKYAWLSVVLLAAGCRTPAPDAAASADENIWRARAAQIQVGMRRLELLSANPLRTGAVAMHYRRAR